MYRILGTDGRQYGPATAEQVREWILQGRANAASRIWVEGGVEWKWLGSLPEFSLLFARTTAASPAAAGRKVHPLAIAGMVCGIISVTFGICCCYGFPFNLAGLALSLTAFLQIRDDPERYNGRGIAMAGLVFSIAGLLLMLILIIVFGFGAVVGGLTAR